MIQDYANLDGKKVARIMKAGDNAYYQYPNGVIKTGEVQDANHKG